ncbi:hypothetical protein, conserved in T. vivax [Trypanosoma vivax Y486]|uniref:Uncharacterized protein n=1 Tax=Trypanosoma vivax (strain Y486) TaxID=1055687 RepID=F9WNE4_TRYVY|nr:hypothetical protein, conserved in T. vivax [Trypanosoma vivax Y486]|eukprot:CCD19062.1 hypothetical protein, conserved in T. vivax [Trypanosoma vivax Y486]
MDQAGSDGSAGDDLLAYCACCEQRNCHGGHAAVTRSLWRVPRRCNCRPRFSLHCRLYLLFPPVCAASKCCARLLSFDLSEVCAPLRPPVVAAARAACTTNRLEYDGHAYAYDVRHGRQLDTACNTSHYVSTLAQFHKERKARCSLLESAPEKAERRGEERRADGLADVEDRKTIQVKRDMAVEGFREAGSLLAWTIYLPKEESDLHCAHECARDFVEDDKCHRRTASLDLPAAKNGVKEGTHKHEVVESSHSCMAVFGRVIPCVEAAGEGVAGC